VLPEGSSWATANAAVDVPQHRVDDRSVVPAHSAGRTGVYTAGGVAPRVGRRQMMVGRVTGAGAVASAATVKLGVFCADITAQTSRPGGAAGTAGRAAARRLLGPQNHEDCRAERGGEAVAAKRVSRSAT